MVPKTLLKIVRYVGLACFGLIPLVFVATLIVCLLPSRWFSSEFYSWMEIIGLTVLPVAFGIGAACSEFAWRSCLKHYAEHGTFAEDDEPETK